MARAQDDQPILAIDGGAGHGFEIRVDAASEPGVVFAFRAQALGRCDAICPVEGVEQPVRVTYRVVSLRAAGQTGA